jgi:hypothetical protein
MAESLHSMEEGFRRGLEEVLDEMPELGPVTADLNDGVARDCEIVGRRLSRDPYTGPEAQHESEVEPDSLTFGRTTVSSFQVGRRANGAASRSIWPEPMAPVQVRGRRFLSTRHS